jgi:NAD(P)-dependent dehydrogenase (short-subunit alcohol dehydrogenase family)
VTGAGSGIGKAVASQFAAEGGRRRRRRQRRARGTNRPGDIIRGWSSNVCAVQRR